jgi:hypothetical protein
MRGFLILFVLLLAGCWGGQTMPVHIDQMTPEQLAAYAKIKDANVMCIIANTPYGQARALFVNVDKGVVPNGMVKVDDQCKAEITNTAPPKTQ